MREFLLEGHEYIELCDLLKVTGLCETGGLAKVAISSGLVKVNNEVELRKRCKVRSGQIVEFEGNTISVK